VPFIVAANLFDGELTHPLEDVRRALQLADDVPLIGCDARDRGSVVGALTQVITHIFRTVDGASPAAATH
jgi:signal recognition particle receptor subunit beta